MPELTDTRSPVQPEAVRLPTPVDVRTVSTTGGVCKTLIGLSPTARPMTTYDTLSRTPGRAFLVPFYGPDKDSMPCWARPCHARRKCGKMPPRSPRGTPLPQDGAWEPQLSHQRCLPVHRWAPLSVAHYW